MTSINTNTSAMAALQTLRQVNTGLSTTQQQVSSGLRVETASDNVAYWSISTTMRSDNKANQAANDALGVGSAKVDVASAGLNNIIDIVSEFRAKLVTASETSVDKTKIQKELAELKTQLTATAQSASFSGVNWLNTSVADNLAYYSSVPEDIVSGFIRNADGTVQVATTQVDTADTSVFNVGGGGALQKDIRSLEDIGGFRNSAGTYQDNSGYQNWGFTGAVTLDADDSIAFDISIDGGAPTSITITKATIDTALGTTNGVINSAYNYSRVLSQALTTAGLSALASVQSSGSSFGIRSDEATGSNESSIQVSNRTITLTPPPTPASNAGGFIDAPTSVPGDYATQAIPFTGPFRVYRDVQFSFDVTLPDKTVESLIVTRDQVDAILGTTDGMVNTAADLALLLNAATNEDGNTLGSAGIIASDGGSALQLTIDSAQYPDKGAS
jgi:flagellin